MKLKAFSQNRPLRHLIHSTVKRHCSLPLVMLLLTGVGFLGFEILGMQELGQPNSITAQLRFRFAAEEVWQLFPYGAFLVAVIAAWVMFGFLFQKKSAQAMLLTGVTRLQLFAVRYLFGLFSVLIPSLVSFSVLLWLGGNNNSHGFPGGFDTAVLLFALGVTVFFAYTAAVLAAALCGRARDFLGVCATFLFGAKGLLLAGGGMCATFLRGFPYPVRQTYDSYNALLDLLDKHYTLSADGIFGKVLENYLLTSSPFAEEQYLKSYLLPVILTAVSALLLIGVCGWRFRERNAEFDGKSGSNPILTAVCTVVLAFSASGIVLMFSGRLSGFLWGLAVAFLASAALYVYFAGSFRKVWKSLRVAGPTLAGMALLALLLYADPLGYGKSVPDAEDIQSVQMTFKGEVLGMVNKGEKGHGNLLHAITLKTEDLPLLESEEDIAVALAVHALLAEDGSRWVKEAEVYQDSAVYADFNVIYRMKDGSEIRRCYTVLKLSTLFETMRLGDTEAFRQREKEGLLDRAENGTTFAISDSMRSFTEALELTVEERKELVTCITEDRARKTYVQQYHPEKECLGVIWMNFFTSDYDDPHMANPVFVYEDDTSTLAWLEAKGLTKCFENSYEIQSVEWFALDYAPIEYVEGWAIERYYTAIRADDYTLQNARLNTVAKEDWESFLADCRLEAFTDGGNKFARITLVNKDGEKVYTTKYVLE